MQNNLVRILIPAIFFGILIRTSLQLIDTDGDIDQTLNQLSKTKVEPIRTIQDGYYVYKWSSSYPLYLTGLVRKYGSSMNFNETTFSLLSTNIMKFPIYNGHNALYTWQIMPSIDGFLNISADQIKDTFKDVSRSQVYTWITTCNFVNYTLVRIANKDGMLKRVFRSVGKWKNASIPCKTVSVARFEIALGSNDMSFRTKFAESLDNVTIVKNKIPWRPFYPFRNITIEIGGTLNYHITIQNLLDPDVYYSTRVRGNFTFNIFTHKLVAVRDIVDKKIRLPKIFSFDYRGEAEYEGNYRQFVDPFYYRKFYYLALSKNAEKFAEQVGMLEGRIVEELKRNMIQDFRYYPEVICLELFGNSPNFYFKNCTVFETGQTRITISYPK